MSGQMWEIGKPIVTAQEGTRIQILQGLYTGQDTYQQDLAAHFWAQVALLCHADYVI